MKGSSYSKTGAMRKSFAILTASLLVAAPLLSAPGVIAADASDAVTATTVNRYFMALANDRCRILPDDAAMALKAGYLQARNAALRAGHSMADLGPWLQRARDAAASVACDNPKLTGAFDDAAAAYRRFIVQTRLDLPGARASWQADRSYGDDAKWRLVQYQNLPAADLAFGVYGGLNAPRFTVMASFHDGQTPYAARLLLRNADLVSEGLIAARPDDVAALPPPGFGDASLSFMARDAQTVNVVLRPSIQTNSAGFSLTGDYVGTARTQAATRFDFPSQAWPAIARLDPREDMVVEFDFDSGPRYVRFEVGDFISGLMYVTLPQPYTHNSLNTAG
jgi:hypothetical protein